RRFHKLRSEHFQRHDAVERLVHRFVNPAHAALAELIEDFVLAEKETSGAAGEQQLGLELGEQFGGDKGAGRAAAAGAVRYARERGRDLRRAHQPALPQVAHELLFADRRRWHGTRAFCNQALPRIDSSLDVPGCLGRGFRPAVAKRKRRRPAKVGPPAVPSIYSDDWTADSFTAIGKKLIEP